MAQDTLQCFNKDGSVVVFCSQNNILKFWNTNLGCLEHEYQDAKYEYSCLQFCSKVEAPNKKSPSKEGRVSQDDLLALGTTDGFVIIYNYTKREATCKLRYSVDLQVLKLCWVSPFRLVAIGKDKLIEWNISSGKKLHNLDIKARSCVCLIGPNHYAVAGIAITYLQYLGKSQKTKSFNLSDHKSYVIQLTPIVFQNDSSAHYVLSASNNDRFLYAWSTKLDQKEAVEIFKVEDAVKGFCYTPLSDSSLAIAVWTRKGCLRYFVQHLNGHKPRDKLAPVSSKAFLKIQSKSNKAMQLPIIGAYFQSMTKLIIIYGNRGLPQFERINLEHFTGIVKYSRKEPEAFDPNKSSIVNTLTPAVVAETSYFMPNQFNSMTDATPKSKKRRKSENSAELPMEARLDSLAITHSVTGLPKGTPLDTCVHRLVQALHSQDSVLLNSILLKGEEDIEVINTTVRKLPVSCVVPFLQYLQQVIAGKGFKNMSLINWIKAVFEHHMSLLSSIPDKEKLMRPFYTICNTRLNTLVTVSQLHSRVHLLLAHVKNRRASQTQDNVHDALLVYKDDDSSEDEDLALGMSGLHSESEETWDYVSDEQPEEEEDDDVAMVNGFSDDDEAEEQVPMTGVEEQHREDDVVTSDEN